VVNRVFVLDIGIKTKNHAARLSQFLSKVAIQDRFRWMKLDQYFEKIKR
jgi:hypothetical protein